MLIINCDLVKKKKNNTISIQHIVLHVYYNNVYDDIHTHIMCIVYIHI